LDIFLMFWVLAAFGCLVIDRDWARERLAEAMEVRLPDDAGPRLGMRWWRLLAGVCLGLACASKWNGIWYVPAFAAMSVAWDIGARRAAGLSRWLYGGLVRDGRWVLASLGVVPAVTYVAAWSDWLFSKTGYDRNWAELHGIHTPVISALVSLYQYNKAILHFDSTLTSHHPYQSQPWSWMVLSRPVSFYYVPYKFGQGGCQVKSCSQEVLAIGTPMIWWVSIATLVICIAWWLTQRDWRAGAVWVSFVAGWFVWFPDAKRTKFLFYMAPLVPFLIIAVTLALGVMLGPALRRPGDVLRDRASLRRRQWGIAGVAVYLGLVVVDFAWMWPIFTGGLLTYDTWHAHMWLPSWV
ncbi:MAG: phospholipid carrier-dependent glycosyltransferase, partial [Pseudonocardiales bacterium]